MTSAACHKSRTILFDYPAAGLLEPRARRESPDGARQRSPDPADTADRRSPAPQRPSPDRAPCTLGRCLRSCDPLGTGRVLVAWQDGMGEECRLWLAPLVGLTIEADDELLLLEPRGAREPVIAGIVARRNPQPAAAATMALAAGQTMTITACDGTELVEVSHRNGGPLVRLCDRDVQWELPGKLRIDAAEIELYADNGPVQIAAQDDVVVRGQTIRLN